MSKNSRRLDVLCVLVCLSFMLMDFTRTWTRAAADWRGWRERRIRRSCRSCASYRMCSKLKAPQWVFQDTSVFSYIVSVAVYTNSIYSWRLQLMPFSFVGLRSFGQGGRWSEMEQRLGVFHQHNELIRLCWLFIVVWMENGNNKSPAICNYLCQWVRLMFISLCQLAAPAPTRCLCLCFCPAICIQFDIR